ncbi:hypothetical protein [Promicromonospora sp. NPDC050249]|uniref:hypothetical protein n=1 Tax=Promicromonospora sp. NPDC050249 TaxID=3154743 RepID=UPI0033E0C489
MRDCLDTDYLELDRTVREGIGFEHHLSVLWDATLPLDSAREVTGAELLTQPFYAADVADALKALEARWDVSVGELDDENYSIMFRSRDTYRSFHDEVLGLAEPDPQLKADVLDLLRPEAEFDDLVALTWDRDFDVAVTLGNVLGIRTR